MSTRKATIIPKGHGRNTARLVFTEITKPSTDSSVRLSVKYRAAIDIPRSTGNADKDEALKNELTRQIAEWEKRGILPKAAIS